MTESSKPRGPYAKTAAKRAAVAEAALDVVIAKGHRGLTTAEVAERAGLTERAMLYHFPTRDHLLVAAMELQDSLNRHAFGEMRERESLDVMAEMPVLIARDSTRHVETLRLFSHLAAAGQDPEHPAHGYMVRHNTTAVESLAGLVRDQQSRGVTHPELDPEATARQMLGVWNGLQSQWLIEPSFDLAEAIGQAFRRISGQPTMEARQLLDDLLSQI